MRHRVSKKHFGRDTNNRKALIRNLVRALVERGEIVTTVAKAKEIKRVSDKLISKAQDDSVETRRILHRFFGKRDVVNTLVTKIAPAMGKRSSGFTRVVKLGKRRGDNAEVAKLGFVEKVEGIGSLKSANPKTPVKKKVASKKTSVKKEVKATEKTTKTKAAKSETKKETK